MGGLKDGIFEQPLPPKLSAQSSTLAEFATQCHDVCRIVLRVFAQALQIPESVGGDQWFSRRHDINEQNGNILRLLRYPANAVDAGAGAHTDYGSITLLLRNYVIEEDGLQVQTASGEWEAAKVLQPTIPGEASPILVNIGDQLSFWTAGLLKSTAHRVRAPPNGWSRERSSIAYFCHPSDNTLLVPVPSHLLNGRERGANAAQEVLTAGEHLRRRLNTSYRWDVS